MILIVNKPKNKDFEAANQHAAQLPYILTHEAKHAKQQQILRLLLAGLRVAK